MEVLIGQFTYDVFAGQCLSGLIFFLECISTSYALRMVWSKYFWVWPLKISFLICFVHCIWLFGIETFDKPRLRWSPTSKAEIESEAGVKYVDQATGIVKLKGHNSTKKDSRRSRTRPDRWHAPDPRILDVELNRWLNVVEGLGIHGWIYTTRDFRYSHVDIMTKTNRINSIARNPIVYKAGRRV